MSSLRRFIYHCHKRISTVISNDIASYDKKAGIGYDISVNIV